MDRRLSRGRGHARRAHLLVRLVDLYPAVQNMLLTARALGLGATLTTLFLRYENAVAAVFGLPADVKCYALLPIGYPLGRFGPVGRSPLDEITYLDKWGQAYAAG